MQYQGMYPSRSNMFTLVFFSLVLHGCGKQKAHPAAAAYDRMVVAMLSGKTVEFVEHLAPASRHELAERIGLPRSTNTSGLGAAIGIRSHWRFESDLLTKSKVIEGEGDPESRWVRTVLAGQPWKVPVRRYDDRWLVDLFKGEPATSGQRPDSMPNAVKRE